MKKVFSLAIAFFAVALIWSQFGAEANNLNIAEKFAARANVSQDNPTGIYSFDKMHSAIGFRIKHMGLVEVPGYFRDFTGTINYDPKDIKNSSVEFTAQMTSIDTGVAPRDKHLRTADFFEVEKYPQMTFKSTRVEKKGKNMLVTGDLTMKGVTKQVSFPFQIEGFLTDAKGGTKMGVTAETVINRRDFGVTYGNTLPNGVAALGDEVKVNLQIEAVLNKKP